MKVLKQLLFTFAIVVGLSLTAFAQKGGQEKPPKPDPPVVKPGDKPKPPKGERPNEDKPKKPNLIFVKTQNESETTFV